MKKNKELFRIDGTDYCSKNPLIIAELGTSHNGDINKARQLIDAAADSGADCIKVQIVYADEILHPNTGIVPLPGGNIRLFDQFKTLENSPDFYLDIRDYTESKGLLFLCTPFGKKSAKILYEMKPKMVKIASPELNYTGLLKEIAAWELPVILSSGVSTLGDIEKAIEILGKDLSQTSNRRFGRGAEDAEENKDSKLCLLHCVTAYPAPETDYNLRLLPNLASIFDVSVGISDHSADPMLVPALAVSMGAAVVEKHFCLSRTDHGLDDPIALEPADFTKMVKAVKDAAKNGSEEIIARYSRERGIDLVETILGDGKKELAPSERANYKRTNRSIHALKDIQKGEIITKENYAVLRTEKILRPGLEPYWEESIEGKTAKNFIPAGEGIRFEDI